MWDALFNALAARGRPDLADRAQCRDAETLVAVLSAAPEGAPLPPPPAAPVEW
eukprot:gene13320-40484_t